jgi:hypothetical protein
MGGDLAVFLLEEFGVDPATLTFTRLAMPPCASASLSDL